MDSEAFVEWVEQVLAPCLSAGDVVVMDNLSVHKVEAVVAAIRARGAYVEFLPPYSPDLNPIEKVWSKLKTALRTAKARTREALDVALRDAIASLTLSDIRGWFDHCGYVVR
jgi:transposase